MPKILIYKNIWIFIFYPTDIYENRKHVHVGKKDTLSLCKIWIEKKVEISEAGDLTLKQQKEVLSIAKKYHEVLIEQWDKFMSGNEIKVIKIK